VAGALRLVLEVVDGRRAIAEPPALCWRARCIDALLVDAKAAGTPIDGADGLLNRMTKAVLERALQAELTHQLGCSTRRSNSR
jgi:putative transposase